MPKAGFINLGTILDQIIFFLWRVEVGEGPLHCGVLRSIPASEHQMPEVTHPIENWVTQKYLQTLPNVPWETNSPLVENH